MAEELKYHEQSEGWTHEWLQDAECLCFMRPREVGGGFVTVDFERRIFSCGYGKPRDAASDTKYEGRGWKNRIIQDAIAHLESVMSHADDGRA